MAMFLRLVRQAASLEFPTLGIYYRESKPVPITPIKWPNYTVNQLGNHTGKKKHMHNFIAKFIVSCCVFCKLQRNFGFFCCINHLSGPLRIHMFTRTPGEGGTPS